MRTSKRPHSRPGGERVGDEPIGWRRQPRVGMKEQDHLARGGRGAGVHLRRPAAPRRQDLVGKRGSAFDGAVAAAAVGDDHLGAALPQRRQRLKMRRDPLRLVQGRDDDRQLHSAASLRRAAAARSLTRGAAVAMPGDADRPAIDVLFQEIAQMRGAAAGADERQLEHLVEVAVVAGSPRNRR